MYLMICQLRNINKIELRKVEMLKMSAWTIPLLNFSHLYWTMPPIMMTSLPIPKNVSSVAAFLRTFEMLVSQLRHSSHFVTNLFYCGVPMKPIKHCMDFIQNTCLWLLLVSGTRQCCASHFMKWSTYFSAISKPRLRLNTALLRWRVTSPNLGDFVEWIRYGLLYFLSLIYNSDVRTVIIKCMRVRTPLNPFGWYSSHCSSHWILHCWTCCLGW